MANLWPLIFCDVSKCGIGNPADEIRNEKVFRPTSDYDILRVNRNKFKARLKPIKCNIIECETVETKCGTEYRFRLTVWAESKED